MRRTAHLVGSLPFEDEELCMRRSLEVLGNRLVTLPDGEIGEKSDLFPRGNRIAWVMYAVERLTADTDGWETVTPPVRGPDGMADGYDTIQKLRPKRTPAEMAAHTSLGYDTEAARTFPMFERLRDEHRLSHLRFQVGLPTGFAMGFAFKSRAQWLRYTSAFNVVLAREADRILEMAPHDVTLQLEVPPELFAAYKLPTRAVALALKPLFGLLAKMSRPARVGVHLCLGDFHNEALVHPKTLTKMVAFSNALVDGWPARHTLDFVHYPFAEGARTPPTDAAWYRPLADVRLPPGARFVAGFVHDRLDFDANRKVLEAIESARGGPVDVSSSCGLGRRSVDVAERVLELTARLCDA